MGFGASAMASRIARATARAAKIEAMRIPGSLVALASSLLLACSSTYEYHPAGTPDGGGTPDAEISNNQVAGTVGGQSLSVQDAVFGKTTMPNGSDQMLTIYLSSSSNACDTLSSGVPPTGETALVMQLGDWNGTGFVLPSPGTYEVWNGTGTAPERTALVTFQTTGSTCMQAKGVSGSIFLSAIGAVVSGSGQINLVANGSATTDTIDVTFSASSMCGTLSSPLSPFACPF
jgi:hypothetical protein